MTEVNSVCWLPGGQGVESWVETQVKKLSYLHGSVSCSTGRYLDTTSKRSVWHRRVMEPTVNKKHESLCLVLHHISLFSIHLTDSEGYWMKT